MRHPCLQIFPPYRLIRTQLLRAVDRFGPDIGLFLDRVFDIFNRPDHYVREFANSPIIRRYLVEMPQAAWEGFNRVVTRFLVNNVSPQVLVHTAGIMQALVDMVSSACRGIISGDILGTLTDWIWGLIWPIPRAWGDIQRLWSSNVGAWQKALAGDFRGTVQKLLDMWDAVNTAFARFSGWIFVISVAIGAAVGAIGGGVGAIPGAYAGAQVAGYIGLANGISFVANAIVQLVLDIESLFNAQAPEPQIPEYSAEEDCAFQSYARLSDRMRLRLIDVAQQANPAAGAALRGLQVSCEAIASDPQARVEEPERLPCQGDDNNREITLRERYQRIAGNMVVVAFTVVLIFAGAAAATLGRRIVQWVLRATQGVRQAMFRFVQRVFVPLRRLASPALRRRIFGRNWSGWLRRRFGLGARDLLGRRRIRIDNENHDLALVRRTDNVVRCRICSTPPCGDLVDILNDVRRNLPEDQHQEVNRLIGQVEELQQAARRGENISAEFNTVRRQVEDLAEEAEVQLLIQRALTQPAVHIEVGPRSNLPGRGVWDIPGNDPRGRAVEQLLGGRTGLPDNMPVIDQFHNGRAVNIKSIDLTLRTYVDNPNQFRNLYEGYIDATSNFAHGQDVTWGRTTIRSIQVTQRELTIAISTTTPTQGQQQVFQHLIQYGSQKNPPVLVRIVELR